MCLYTKYTWILEKLNFEKLSERFCTVLKFEISQRIKIYTFYRENILFGDLVKTQISSPYKNIISAFQSLIYFAETCAAQVQNTQVKTKSKKYLLYRVMTKNRILTSHFAIVIGSRIYTSKIVNSSLGAHRVPGRTQKYH